MESLLSLVRIQQHNLDEDEDPEDDDVDDVPEDIKQKMRKVCSLVCFSTAMQKARLYGSNTVHQIYVFASSRGS